MAVPGSGPFGERPERPRPGIAGVGSFHRRRDVRRAGEQAGRVTDLAGHLGQPAVHAIYGGGRGGPGRAKSRCRERPGSRRRRGPSPRARSPGAARPRGRRIAGAGRAAPPPPTTRRAPRCPRRETAPGGSRLQQGQGEKEERRSGERKRRQWAAGHPGVGERWNSAGLYSNDPARVSPDHPVGAAASRARAPAGRRNTSAADGRHLRSPFAPGRAAWRLRGGRFGHSSRSLPVRPRLAPMRGRR